jgi:hypothetical protein
MGDVEKNATGRGVLFEIKEGLNHLIISCYDGCRLRADTLQKTKTTAFLECPNLHCASKTGRGAAVAILS